MLKYQIVPVTSFQQNCTLFWCDLTRQAAIIDPGGEYQKIIQHVEANQLQVSCILLTHGHLDHVGAAVELAKHYQVDILGPQEADLFWFDELPQQGISFGFGVLEAFTPTKWLNEGDTIQIGNESLAVFHCPGHTPGHIIFYSASAKLAQVGDVLFKGSIGRTDFPQGNVRDLFLSITTKLWPLGDDVTFIPGHGPTSTFGTERKTNPFVSDLAIATHNII